MTLQIKKIRSTFQGTAYETDIMTNDDSGADDSAVSPDSSNVQNVPNSGTGAKVRFTYPDRSYVDKPLSDFDTDTYDNENVKVLTYEAVPAKLTEKVDISIIKGDGTQSNSYVFSPADYLDEFLSGQDENGIIVKQKAIAMALLIMEHMRSFILTRIHQTWQIRI